MNPKIKMGIDLLMTVLLICLGFSGMIMSFYALKEQTKQITKNESA